MNYNDIRNHHWRVAEGQKFVVFATSACRRKLERHLKSGGRIVDIAKEMDDFRFGRHSKRKEDKPIKNCPVKTPWGLFDRRQVHTEHGVGGTAKEGRWVYFRAKATQLNSDASEDELEHIYLIDFTYPKRNFDPCRANYHSASELVNSQASQVNGPHTESQKYTISEPILVGIDNDDLLRWMKSRVNFRLTDEQIEAIEQPAPLFINGQAGSGKSILLAFRLAEVYNARKEKESRPLFTAMSPSVIEQVEEDVRDYLERHYPDSLEDFDNDLENQKGPNWRSVPDVVFKSVQDIFLSMMKSDQALHFTTDGKKLDVQRSVGYGLFRNWFNSLTSVDRLTADFAWFGIRSIILGGALRFIDGFNEDDTAEPSSKGGYVPMEQFRNQPGHHWFSSVYIQELYAVFDKYQSWKSSSRMFDDMDLAIAALRNSAEIEPAFTELYIDEAQDLTPLELNALMLLLKPERRHHLILAGDPQQTINPTGFDWDAIRSMIHDMVNANAEPWQRHDVAQPFNITTNFRSTAEVVDVGNLVLKQSRFYNKETHVDQKASATNHGDKPLLIPLDLIGEEHLHELFFDPNLAENRQNIVLASDVFQMNQCIDEIKNLKTVSDTSEHRFETIVQVKGREAPAVILYRPTWRLDDEDKPYLIEKNDFGLRNALNEARKVKIRFLFNQIYIGVTRAEYRLIIIEDGHKIDRILSPLFDSTVNVVKDRVRAEIAIDAFLQHSRDNIDPEEAAKKNYKKYQDSGRDTMYLEWAISDANRAGNDRLYYSYLAEYEENLAVVEIEDASLHRTKAAEYWAKIGNYWKAFENYQANSDWKMAWSTLNSEGNRHAFERMGPAHRRLLGFLARDPSMIDTLWDEMADSLGSLNGLMDEWQKLPLINQKPELIDDALYVLLSRVNSSERVRISLMLLLPNLLSGQSRYVQKLNQQIESEGIQIDNETALRVHESMMSNSFREYFINTGAVLTKFISLKQEELESTHDIQSKIQIVKSLCEIGEDREAELFLLQLQDDHEYREQTDGDRRLDFQKTLSMLDDNTTLLKKFGIEQLRNFDNFSPKKAPVPAIFRYLRTINGLATPSDNHPDFWAHADFAKKIKQTSIFAFRESEDLLKDKGRGFTKYVELTGPDDGLKWVVLKGKTEDFAACWQEMKQSPTLDEVREKVAFHINNLGAKDLKLTDKIEQLLALGKKDSFNPLKSIKEDDLTHWMKLFKVKKPTKSDLSDLQAARAKMNRIPQLHALVTELDRLISQIPRELDEVLADLGKHSVDEVLNQVVRVKSASWDDVIEPIQSWPGYITWVKRFSKRLADRTSSDWETTMSSLQAWKAKLGTDTDASFFRLICQFPEGPGADLTEFCLMLLKWEELGANDESSFIEKIRESQYDELDQAHSWEYLQPISNAINNEDIPHALRAAIYAHTIWYCNEFTLTASGGGKPTVDQMKERIALFNPSKKMSTKTSRTVALTAMDDSTMRMLPKENKDALREAYVVIRALLKRREETKNAAK